MVYLGEKDNFFRGDAFYDRASGKYNMLNDLSGGERGISPWNIYKTTFQTLI